MINRSYYLMMINRRLLRRKRKKMQKIESFPRSRFGTTAIRTSLERMNIRASGYKENPLTLLPPAHLPLHRRVILRDICIRWFAITLQVIIAPRTFSLIKAIRMRITVLGRVTSTQRGIILSATIYMPRVSRFYCTGELFRTIAGSQSSSELRNNRTEQYPFLETINSLIEEKIPRI